MSPAFVFHGIACCVALFIALINIEQKVQECDATMLH